MKKALAIVLTLVMVLTLSVTAFADVLNYDDNNTSGKIVIENAVKNAKYTAYRLFILDSYSNDGKYAYSVPEDMVDFVLGDGAAYLTFDEEDNWVTWNADNTAATIQAFATAARDYIETEAPALATAEATATEDGVVTLSGLKLGYWLVISDVGNDNVLALDTTNPTATVYEKNAQPSLEKVVKEDSTGKWGETNTADIGDTINFMVTVNAVGHVKNYVLHDTMSAGLTFNADSVALTWNGAAVDASNYDVITTTDDNCTFHIDLEETFEAALNEQDATDVLVFTYTAELNADAAINTGDVNTVDLTYTNEYDDTDVPDVPEDSTTTFTFDFTVDKFGTNVATGTTATKLEGVKFELYTDNNGAKGTKIGFTIVGTAYEYNSDVAATDYILITDADGAIKVQGLDAATYWLVETETNAGYNLLKNPIKVVIGEDGKITYTNSSNGQTDIPVDEIISIENKSGVELPATGGMGTMLFILIGSLLVMATGVVLVTNKRMSKIAD